jgi:hypothetical protein
VLKELETNRRRVWIRVCVNMPQDLHENVNTGSYVGLQITGFLSLYIYIYIHCVHMNYYTDLKLGF